MHTENMSMLLDAVNTRQHFPGVVDLAKRLQAFMTSHSKAIASKDLLRITKDAPARGSGVDSARLSVCLPNLVSFSPEHLEQFDTFLTLCIRDVCIKAVELLLV